MTTPRSDSAVQRAAEAVIRRKLAAFVGKDLAPATVTFDTGACVQVDAVASDESVLAEIFARQGQAQERPAEEGRHRHAQADHARTHPPALS